MGKHLRCGKKVTRFRRCLHQNLEEGFQRLENSQNHVSEESIACRSKTADLDIELESAFFR